MEEPNFTAAAIRAAETLVTYNVSYAPVSPLPILKTMPGIIVMSFAEIALSTGAEREHVISSFGELQDAVTLCKKINGETKYIVAYNQRLPVYIMQRGLARELGHIMLHHDGSKPEWVRTQEAMCFARHLICPRPLIKALQECGVKLTIEVLGNVTGCCERCLEGLRETPGTHVPPEINRTIRKQFENYIHDFVSFQEILSRDDKTQTAEFGTYMDGYTEEE